MDKARSYFLASDPCYNELYSVTCLKYTFRERLHTMTQPDTLTTLFRHHRWANLMLLEQCAKLSDEQLDSTIVGTFGTIRETLEHIMLSDQSYIHRISTGKPLRRAADAPPFSITELRQSAQQTGDQLIEWATKVHADETVTIDWDGTLREVPKTIILTQAINHATEHRAQIMAILTQLGIEPAELSGWAYFDSLVQAAA